MLNPEELEGRITSVYGRQWWGWLVAALNCFVLLYIAHESGLSGLIPANIICLAIYAKNTREWLKGHTRKVMFANPIDTTPFLLCTVAVTAAAQIGAAYLALPGSQDQSGAPRGAARHVPSFIGC